MSAKPRIDESGKAHAPLPPSASSQWIACSPSMAYVAALIDAKIIKKRVSGDAAKRGTRIHELGESLIRWMLKGKKTDNVKGDANEIAEARAYAERCVEMIDEAKLLDSDVRYGIEDRAIVDEEHCWGSRDFWLYAVKRLTIVDLKTGFEEVPVKGNTQLLIYAIDKFEELQPDEVEVAIWQPNADDGTGPEKSHVYTRDEMRAYAKQLRIAVDSSKKWFKKRYKEMEPYLVAGSHCGWCDALGVCPSARKLNQSISKGNFMPVPVKSSKGSQLPSAADMTPEQVSQILERAQMFTDWLDAVKVHALELAQKGKSIPGFKVVAKNTRYAWNRELTPEKVAKSLGLKISDVVEMKLLSPSKIRNKAKGKAKDKIAALTWRPFEVTIAKESDRRTAIPSTKINFQPVFRNEEDDDV